MLKKVFTSTLLSLIAVGGFFVNVEVPGTNRITSVGIPQTYAACTPTQANDYCFGQNGATGNVTTQEAAVKDMLNKLIVGLNTIANVFTIIVSPAIILAGWLMSPDWTSGDFFGIRGVLHSLWVLVANITYFIYAILLIFIALATIFNSQKFGYKQMLPKLALGILLVPLTWWFVQFIISLSTIVTASVVNIPLDTVKTYMESRNTGDNWYTQATIPRQYDFYMDEKANIGTGSESPDCPDVDPNGANGECISPEKILSSAGGLYSGLLIYGNSIFKLGEIRNLSLDINAVTTIGSLANRLIISILMFVVFGMLVLGLVFMLLMRAIKLWFYAIFAPLFTLQFVVGDGLLGKEGSEEFKFKEFIGLAFVPTLVGLALSFGLMIITILYSSSGAPSGSSPCTLAQLQNPDEGCVIASIMGIPANEIRSFVAPLEYADGSPANGGKLYTYTDVTIGGVTMTFYGSAVENASDTLRTIGTTTGVLSAAGGFFGTIIIDIIALIFIWTAVMAAKNVSKVASAAIKPFEEIGSKVGKMAMTLPKYTPLPLPGGSIAGMNKTVELAGNKLDEIHRQKEMESIGRQFPGLVQGIIKPEEISKLNTAISNNSASTEKGTEAIAKSAASVLATGEKNSTNHSIVAERTSAAFKGNEATLETVIKSKGIFDPKEIDLMKKFLLNEKLSDTDRSKAHDLVQKSFGSSSSNATATGTTTAATNGNGKIVIDGIQINYTGLDLKQDPKVLGEKIATYIESKKDKIERPSDEKLERILDDLSVDGLTKDKVLISLKEKLEKVQFKESSSKSSK